jgi:hypothetical protein
VDSQAVFRCGEAWNGAVITVRGRAGLHLDFESQSWAPCGLKGGVVALDEGAEPAWPPRPIMDRIDERPDAAPPYRYSYRPLLDVDGASCHADSTGVCCAHAVPIGGAIIVRGELVFSTQEGTRFQSASIHDAALCVVR